MQEALIEELREKHIAQIIISAQTALRDALVRNPYKGYLNQIAGVKLTQKNRRTYL